MFLYALDNYQAKEVFYGKKESKEIKEKGLQILLKVL
jgi:hypothetical protein